MATLAAPSTEYGEGEPHLGSSINPCALWDLGIEKPFAVLSGELKTLLSSTLPP
jgi:hypothetical protein